jgi:hypothetical protein
MLLSMSKQFFPEQLFTHSALDEACIYTFPSFEAIPQQLLFHTIEDYRLPPPAVDGFPVRPYPLGFSVGTGGILSQSEGRVRSRFLYGLRARSLPATRSTFWISLRSYLRPRQKEDYDERCETES